MEYPAGDDGWDLRTFDLAELFGGNLTHFSDYGGDLVAATSFLHWPKKRLPTQ